MMIVIMGILIIIAGFSLMVASYRLGCSHQERKNRKSDLFDSEDKDTVGYSANEQGDRFKDREDWEYE